LERGRGTWQKRQITTPRRAKDGLTGETEGAAPEGEALGQYVHIPAQEVTSTTPAAVNSEQTGHPDRSTQMQDGEDDNDNSDEGRKITGRPLYVILVRKHRGQVGRN
jgi:hypothetical protein